MKKRILSVIVAALLILSLLPNAFAASDFASEVPASVDATKTQYNYVFNRANVGISSANVEEATSYSKVVSGDAWKFANQAGMENYSFNGDNGITLRTNVADVGNGANVVFALYVPKAGKYTFEYNSYSRDNSGSLDIYFAKCPADFVANSFGANLPFGESDKVADDLSFYVAGQTVIDYRALDNVVTVPEAGTYLVAFTDFKTVSGVDYDSSNLGSGDIGKIRQEIRSIRLTETFGGEVPANATIDTEYNYVFGHDYVGLTANADVNGVTSYSQVTNTAATDYWKFAAKSDMANTTLNGGSNGVYINTNSSSSYMIMALYIPSAGKYNVSFDYIKRTDNCTFDMYFAKCPDTFAAGSGFPFVAGDKIAEDCSFGNGDPWSRGNVLDGVVEVPSAGTYLIGFTDSKISGVGAATNLTLYNIKLTETFAGEVPAGAEADTEYNYVFGRKYVNISSNDTSLANRYSLINAAETDYWKFAGQSGMITCELNGDNGVFIKTNDSSSYMVMALYIPSAGKYNVSFDYIKRTDNCTLDMYFAKCSDTFAVGSGFPFVAGDKIAEDYSFGNGDPWSRDNVLEML
ncbi:MAG: hypothetical protein IKM21_04140 [Oscillospiraceae bacterium]|nr:hypothetical protein [Oscillospiraceae bacterium]